MRYHWGVIAGMFSSSKNRGGFQIMLCVEPPSTTIFCSVIWLAKIGENKIVGDPRGSSDFSPQWNAEFKLLAVPQNTEAFFIASSPQRALYYTRRWSSAKPHWAQRTPLPASSMLNAKASAADAISTIIAARCVRRRT